MVVARLCQSLKPGQAGSFSLQMPIGFLMSQIAETSDEPCRRSWHALIFAQVVAFTALGCFCTVSQRYLFADGAVYFLRLLQACSLSDLFPARYFAHLLTQSPAVVLLQVFDCRDIGVVGFTYGATQFLTPVAGLLLTWWVARKAPAHYLAFPMLSLSILYLNTSFLMFREFHSAVWLFWCMLYLLMFSERLTVARSVLLIVLAVLATRTDESYLFLAWPLVLVAWKRGRVAWATQRHGETLVCLVAGLLFVFASSLALHSTTSPFAAGNREEFANLMIEHLACSTVRFSIVVILGALWYSLLPRTPGRSVIWIVALFCGLALVVAILLGFHDRWSFQDASRVQALYVPLLFGSLVALNPPSLRVSSFNLADRQLGLWRLAALTCGVSVLFQFTATARWNEYRGALVNELSKHCGVISYTGSAERTDEFDWGWTMPSLSVTLSALNLESVSTIICQPDLDAPDPFDPRNHADIPDLRKYGVSTELGKSPTGVRLWPAEPASPGLLFPIMVLSLIALIGRHITQRTDVSRKMHVKDWQALAAAQFTAFAAVGCYSIWAQRYLYGDGANFLLMLLKRREVTDYFPGRHFAHLVTQFPMVFLLRDLGCRDVRVLAAVYGATLYLLPLGCLLLTWWASRRAPAHSLVYPLVGFSFVFLNVSGFIISESHIAAAIFWPILYLLLFSERFTLVRSVVLIALAVVATRAYESYLFLAWPLIFAAVHRCWKAACQGKPAEFLTCYYSYGLFLKAFTNSVESLLDPLIPANSEGFSFHVRLHLLYPPVWFSLLTLAGILWCAILPQHRSQRRIVRIATCACGLFVILLPCAGAVGPWFQYCARVQTVYVPLVLGSIVVLKTMTARSRSDDDPGRQFELWNLAAGACVVAAAFQWGSTALWDGYRCRLLNELAQRRGVIDYEQEIGGSAEDERLARSPAVLSNRRLEQFNWGWTMPSLSVALSALDLGSISTIICVPKETEWQPFDPRNPREIPDLHEFGVPANLPENMHPPLPVP